MADPEIRGVLERIHRLRGEVEEREGEEAVLWKRVYAMADEIAGEDESWRWTHPQLKWTIGRIMAENSPRLDPAKLELSLTEEQWRQCTRQVRIFDLERLTEMVNKELISQDDVNAATEQKPPTSRKHFKAASKDELRKLAEEAAS